MERLKAAAQAGDIEAMYASYSPFKTSINLPNVERLNAAAQAGDIDGLYALIREDAFVLERIDKVPFVDTPLHVAASSGQTDFAMEIVTLMPSYARKLNQERFSPMHLAVSNGINDLVLCLIELDEDLIRVKGRKGMTPLHYAAELENQLVLAKFLVACPECIKDVTTQGETALHIALKNNKIEAFKILVGWIRRSTHKDARNLEDLILNWKDIKGNNVLHIAAHTGQFEAVGLLFPSLLDVNIKNENRKTALQIAKDSGHEEIIDMLRWRTKFLFFLPSVSSLTKQLKSKISIFEIIGIHLKRENASISSDTRDSLLVVFALVATENYDAALSPPGGLWGGQLPETAPLPNIFHTGVDTPDTKSSPFLHSTVAAAAAPPPTQLGTIIMDPNSFDIIWWLNTLALLITFFLILFLFPKGTRTMLAIPLCLMGMCYALSMSVISPVKYWSEIFFLVLVSLIYFVTWIRPFQELRARAYKREWGTAHIF